MKKEHLISRLVELEKEINENRSSFNQHNEILVQLNARYNSLHGARNECQKFLAQICESEIPDKIEIINETIYA